MASCDDDFSLLGDDNAPPQPSPPPTNPNLLHHHHHHHHHHFAALSHHFPPNLTPIDTPPSHCHSPPPQTGICPSNAGASPDRSAGDGDRGDGDSFSDGAFCSQEVNHFNENQSDPSKSAANFGRERRKEGEEFSNGGTTPYTYKKQKIISTGSGSGGGGGEFRKDREEWSDTAVGCLLDMYLEKFAQLNRGNLRGKDWEEVAAYVSERSEKQTKSVEQCKNKVDNLKKRYKLERHRMNNGGSSASHWPWFCKMELIIGTSLQAKAASEDDKPVTSATKQTKRYGVSPASGLLLAKPKSSINPPKWRRVVFKISGAALAGAGGHSIDPKVATLITKEVSTACRLGVEVAIVVGGRNLFCGDTWFTSTGLDRCTAYQIGMMATVMNSILLQSTLEKMGIQTRVQSAFSMPEVAEPYNRQRAIRHLEKGRVVIFGGIGAGTGNPMFSTDTVAALRASEIHADAVLKGTNVDGVYLCDSRGGNLVSEHISFRDLTSRGSSQMDMMAATFCQEHGIPVVIFNLHEPGNISRALCGEQVGTLIDQTGRIS